MTYDQANKLLTTIENLTLRSRMLARTMAEKHVDWKAVAELEGHVLDDKRTLYALFVEIERKDSTN